jgi:hypothetical protein
MLVKAKTSFQSTYHGDITVDDQFDCDSASAQVLIEAGMVEAVQPVKVYYNTKVVGNEPQVGDVPLERGPVSESSSSPAAPASPKKTRKSSKAKK